MVRLQREPILIDLLLGPLRSDEDGALALFVGVVRAEHRGRRVRHLEYEAYEEMALAEMERLLRAARERFAVSAVALVHRLGRLEIGEAAVAVAVAAPHRAAAFDACRFTIDTLKRTVPIWKKEVSDRGEVWIEGPGEGDGEDAPQA